MEYFPYLKAMSIFIIISARRARVNLWSQSPCKFQSLPGTPSPL